AGRLARALRRRPAGDHPPAVDPGVRLLDPRRRVRLDLPDRLAAEQPVRVHHAVPRDAHRRVGPRPEPATARPGRPAVAQGDAGLTPAPDALRAAPKALLHDHLDGGLRPAT